MTLKCRLRYLEIQSQILRGHSHHLQQYFVPKPKIYKLQHFQNEQKWSSPRRISCFFLSLSHFMLRTFTDDAFTRRILSFTCPPWRFLVMHAIADQITTFRWLRYQVTSHITISCSGTIMGTLIHLALTQESAHQKCPWCSHSSTSERCRRVVHSLQSCREHMRGDIGEDGEWNEWESRAYGAKAQSGKNRCLWSELDTLANIPVRLIFKVTQFIIIWSATSIVFIFSKHATNVIMHDLCDFQVLKSPAWLLAAERKINSEMEIHSWFWASRIFRINHHIFQRNHFVTSFSWFCRRLNVYLNDFYGFSPIRLNWADSPQMRVRIVNFLSNQLFAH